jgi:hypothetical protein
VRKLSVMGFGLAALAKAAHADLASPACIDDPTSPYESRNGKALQKRVLRDLNNDGVDDVELAGERHASGSYFYHLYVSIGSCWRLITIADKHGDDRYFFGLGLERMAGSHHGYKDVCTCVRPSFEYVCYQFDGKQYREWPDHPYVLPKPRVWSR